MDKRKVVFDFIVIMSAFLVFTLWYSRVYNHETAVTTVNDSEEVVYYLIPHEFNSEFWRTLNGGVSDMANLLGVSYILKVPKNRDPQDQIKLIQEAVENGADVILLGSLDPDVVSSAVEDAQSKGVKFIYVDAPGKVEATTTLATDNYQAGRIAAETIIKELEAVGIESGSIGLLGITPETITTSERERGFKEVIISNNRYTLLDSVYTKADIELAEAAAKDYIESNQDLVGIFATNEENTVGLGNAIKDSSKNIVGVGFDLTRTIQDMIRAGDLNAVLVQNPYTMGYLGMAEAYAAAKGYSTGPKFINTGVSIVDKYTPKRIN
ncbi:MAG TPA: substrate-binding domain-containing protein [Lachnospiraceae bacterium]|nr:substrate-binding domain-containing protein [Lachnospiraceae bacterium]